MGNLFCTFTHSCLLWWGPCSMHRKHFLSWGVKMIIRTTKPPIPAATTPMIVPMDSSIPNNPGGVKAERCKTCWRGICNVEQYRRDHWDATVYNSLLQKRLPPGIWLYSFLDGQDTVGLYGEENILCCRSHWFVSVQGKRLQYSTGTVYWPVVHADLFLCKGWQWIMMLTAFTGIIPVFFTHVT